MARNDYRLDANERADVATLTVETCCCHRPLTLRAVVLDLPDGSKALDADSLRRAVHIHVSRCGGR